MPDESDFRKYNSIEEYMETAEGSKYYHDLFMRAVNNPIRREILNIVNQSKKISNQELFFKLKSENILDDENIFNYNIDYLIKALCIKVIKDDINGQIFYEITQSGQVVDWL